MPAVDVVPTTNELITDAVLFEKLTVPQLVKNSPNFLQIQSSSQITENFSIIKLIYKLNTTIQCPSQQKQYAAAVTAVTQNLLTHGNFARKV
jgi:hypothetical protein